MKNIKTFILLAFVFCSTNVFSQLRKTIHQTVDLSRSISVKLDLTGDYELVNWPGNHFLIETNIALYDASKHLLKFMVEQGRYEVLFQENGLTASLDWKDKERRKLMYKDKECFEETKVKIYIPDFFEIINPTTLVNNKLKEEFPDKYEKAKVPPKVEEAIDSTETIIDEGIIEN